MQREKNLSMKMCIDGDGQIINNGDLVEYGVKPNSRKAYAIYGESHLVLAAYGADDLLHPVDVVPRNNALFFANTRVIK